MCGYDVESFWDQTPRTLSLAFEAQKNTNEIKFVEWHNHNAWLAWNVAAMQRAKRIPSLNKLRIRQVHEPKQRLEDQLEGLKNWVQASGGKVIYRQ